MAVDAQLAVSRCAVIYTNSIIHYITISLLRCKFILVHVFLEGAGKSETVSSGSTGFANDQSVDLSHEKCIRYIVPLSGLILPWPMPARRSFRIPHKIFRLHAWIVQPRLQNRRTNHGLQAAQI